MRKLPIGLKVTLIIFLLMLQMCIMFFLFSIKTTNNYNIDLTQFEYYFIFAIISLTAFLLGVIYSSSMTSWSIDSLIEKADNIITINNIIIALQGRKSLIKSSVPDPLEIVMKSYSITTGKTVKS
jgi:hypothetical protein